MMGSVWVWVRGPPVRPCSRASMHKCMRQSRFFFQQHQRPYPASLDLVREVSEIVMQESIREVVSHQTVTTPRVHPGDAKFIVVFVEGDDGVVQLVAVQQCH